MYKRFISFILSIVILTLCVGCTGNSTSSIKIPVPVRPEVNKAQAVAAISPVLVFDGDNAVVAFNDIKNAVQSDRKAAVLSALEDDTDFCWAYNNGSDWKKRGIYALDKWCNGRGANIKTLNAYSFNADFTDSLMPFTAKSAEIEMYGEDSTPDYGLILSTSENTREALVYTVPQDGMLTVQSGIVAAVQSIDGVKTGFLAEDGTERSAVIRIDINSRRYYSGVLANSSAASGGTAVTSLTYPEISDIPVSAGDLVFFSIEFNGLLNEDDSITKPAEENQTVDNSTSGSSNADSEKPAEDKVTQISFLNGFDARFTIIYPEKADLDFVSKVQQLSEAIEKVLKAEQPYRADYTAEFEYELLIGETNRPASERAYRDLREARTNYADDYIIRMDGNNLVVAAGSDTAMERALAELQGYCDNARSYILSNLNVVYRKLKTNRMLGANNIASYVIRTEQYPSYLVKQAAMTLQQTVLETTGYFLPIQKDTSSSKYEILIGPNTRGTKMLSGINDYEIELNGSTLTVNVGSTTAANAAMLVFCEKLKKGNIADGYKLSGNYNDGAYSLTGGYGLTWFDDFSGETLDLSKWVVMNDTTDGPWYKISEVEDKIKNNIGGPWLDTTVSGTPVSAGYIQEGVQNRPGIEGENFYLKDGKLVEVTKKSKNGYDAVRLYTSNKMRYRYGYTEVRIKMATNNGACSAVWLALNGNEIDLNENYGQDAYYSNLHTWTPSHIDHVHNGDMKQIWVYPEEGHHFYDEYHYLGFEWTDKYIAFYLDGEVTQYVDISSSTFNVFRKLIALKLANGVGTQGYSIGNNPGDYMGDNVDKFREEQEIDFVRIYQKDSSKYKMSIG